ncbi:MAG: class I SAM-dependent methyltransferase [Candidatus Eiseniibacteriota bacterium]
MNDTRDLVRRQFGAHADRYVNSPEHAKGESLDRMIALAVPQSTWKVLDVATGGGHTALAVAPHVREVVATDLTPEMVRAAKVFVASKGITNVSFREADAEALPFGDGEFDMVTCRIAPHHFPDVPRFVREVHRVLRRGGVSILIDNVVPEEPVAAEYINRFEKVRDPSHNWSHSESEWLRYYRDAGFGDLHAEFFRKVRNFDDWTGRMSVDEETKGKLRVMLADAPATARYALAPEQRNGVLFFYLDEILIRGTKR